MKTDVEELQESLSFTQNNLDQRYLSINEKVQSLKKALILTKDYLGVIQTTEPTWTLEIPRKSVDVKDGSRRNNL